MNLTTHLFFSLALGCLLFGQPGPALLVALGALLPDLDREYWFMKTKQYRDEQLHRSLFHNFFVVAAVFLVNPFVSLGMFLHSFQDSLTTVKDRGCEWLYPASRFVKRGRKNFEGEDEPLNPKEHIYFYQEDSRGLLETADPDLQVAGDKPVPWRRTYGPALNGQLLDTGFLVGSISLILLWAFLPDASNAERLAAFFSQNWRGCLLGFGSVVLLFAAGELDRRFRAETSHICLLDVLKVALFLAGLGVGGYGLYFYRNDLVSSLLAHNWLFIILSAAVVVGVSAAVIALQIKVNKTATV